MQRKLIQLTDQSFRLFLKNKIPIITQFIILNDMILQYEKINWISSSFKLIPRENV